MITPFQKFKKINFSTLEDPRNPSIASYNARLYTPSAHSKQSPVFRNYEILSEPDTRDKITGRVSGVFLDIL